MNETQPASWNQNSPLTTAIATQNDPLIPRLIDAGANVNPDVDNRWLVPLTCALRWGTHRSVQVLLYAGADPNAHPADGLALLSWPAFIGDLRGARQMLDGGADAAAQARAVIVAAQHAQPGIIELLAANGADVAMPHVEGTALERAERRGDADTIALLREWQDIRAGSANERDHAENARAALLRAVLDDDAATLRRLLREQPALAQLPVVRSHLFHYASGLRQTHADRAPLAAAVEVLAEFGVPWTVAAAAACGPIAVLERLLADAGADALRDGLHAAAKMDRVDALRFLLDAGAAIDAKHTWGTALHQAVTFKSFAAVDFLLANGANPNATDQGGATPLARNGLNRDRVRIRDALLAHGARKPRPG